MILQFFCRLVLTKSSNYKKVLHLLHLVNASYRTFQYILLISHSRDTKRASSEQTTNKKKWWWVFCSRCYHEERGKENLFICVNLFCVMSFLSSLKCIAGIPLSVYERLCEWIWNGISRRNDDNCNERESILQIISNYYWVEYVF